MNTIINIIIGLDLILVGIEFLYINKAINKLRFKVRQIEDNLIANELNKAINKAHQERIDELANQVQNIALKLDKNKDKPKKRIYKKIEEFNNGKFVLVRGSEVIAKGTVAEISKQTGKSPEALRKLNNPHHLAKTGKRITKLLKSK